ncbi:hypothetical protein [Clostridium sp. CTA-6]
MAKQPKHGLMETKGQFQFRGIVEGTQRDDFFSNKTTKNKKDMNLIKFSIKTNENNKPKINLNGMEQDNVYFYKRPKTKDEKGVSKKVPWTNRKTFDEEGFQLIGVKLGLNKVENEKGQEVNEKKNLTDYDACAYIRDNLIDDLSIFTKGNIEYSSYKNDKGDLKRNLKFTPAQISLCKDEIDFSKDDFKETSVFQQVIVFMGIKKDDSDKTDKKFIVSAKIVTYNSIEDAEFVIRNENLAKVFRTKLKPYMAIKVWGDINNKVIKEEANESDCWGEVNSFDQVGGTFLQELVITGADPKTIDKDMYSKEKMENAIRILKEFGEEKNQQEEAKENNEEQWGENMNSNDSNEEGDEWDNEEW